jgi:taurine dioxygenase
MRPTFDRLPENFGVEVRDIDIPSLTDEDLKALLQHLYTNRFVVLRAGELSKEAFITFSRCIGNPILLSIYTDGQYPEISTLTNVGTDTKKEKRGAAHWHSDQSFKQEVSSVTMLYSVEAPEHGGETQFCDMVSAYRALPEETHTQIDKLIVEHRHGVSISARPGDHTPVPPDGWDQSQKVYHPLVRTHPVTGEKTLYAIAGTCQGIKGMEQCAAETLLKKLGDHAFQDRFITRHKHTQHDLVLWDNATTMHSATPLSESTGPHDTRVIHRISVRDYPPLFDSVNASETAL